MTSSSTPSSATGRPAASFTSAVRISMSSPQRATLPVDDGTVSVAIGELLGASVESIRLAEDREAFRLAMEAAGLPVLPAGIREVGGGLCVSFGPPFVPRIPCRRAERDAAVAGQVMDAVARLLS